MFKLGFTAIETHFGSSRPEWPIEQLLDMELLWVDAALQEPRTVNLDEIRRRYHELMAQKYGVSAERMRVDADTLRRWPTPDSGT
jgi:hypothetical protein